MNINISDILQRGEGITVEFKKAKNKVPESLFDSVCAFLNRNGGTVLLGVQDDGTVEGIESDAVQQMKKDIVNMCNNPQKLMPTFLLEVKAVEYQGKNLLQIFVPVSSQVHRCNGLVYDRNADGDFVLRTDEQIKQCYIRKNSAYSENIVYPYLYESDFVPGLVQRTRQIIQINFPDHPWNSMTNKEFFYNSGLWRRDLATGIEGFTMAALLLFGNDAVITSAVPHYKIDAFLRRRDLDRYDDRENIRCNIIEAYDKLMAFVKKHLPDKFYLEGIQRMSLRDKIFREVVANILIHREYTNAYPTSFTIYKDKVEAKNANKPHTYGQLLPNRFEPFPKNPHLAQIFTLMGRSEEAGTGTRNIYKYSKAYSGSENIQLIEEDVFISQVPLNEQYFVSDTLNDTLNDTNDTLNDTLNDTNDTLNANQRNIINLISKNQLVKQKEIAKTLDISIETVKREMLKLIKMNKIQREGSRKSGYWVVL
jgi:ATP-dependent DNA helicase RecG